MAVYKPEVGDVGFSKKGYIYVFLGYREVPIAYASGKSLADAKPQTVELWFSHTHFPKCDERGKIVTYIKQDLATEMQFYCNQYEKSHTWDHTFIATIKPKLILFDFKLSVNEGDIVEYFKPKYQTVTGNRYDAHKHRIKHYLCYGEWSRKKTIDNILKNL